MSYVNVYSLLTVVKGFTGIMYLQARRSVKRKQIFNSQSFYIIYKSEEAKQKTQQVFTFTFIITFTHKNDLQKEGYW